MIVINDFVLYGKKGFSVTRVCTKYRTQSSETRKSGETLSCSLLCSQFEILSSSINRVLSVELWLRMGIQLLVSQPCLFSMITIWLEEKKGPPCQIIVSNQGQEWVAGICPAMETGLAIWLFTVQKFLIVVGHGTVLQRTRPPVLRYPHSQTNFLSTRPGVLNGITAYMQQFHLPSHDTSPILYNQKKSPKWRCCFAFF